MTHIAASIALLTKCLCGYFAVKIFLLSYPVDADYSTQSRTLLLGACASLKNPSNDTVLNNGCLLILLTIHLLTTISLISVQGHSSLWFYRQKLVSINLVFKCSTLGE